MTGKTHLTAGLAAGIASAIMLTENDIPLSAGVITASVIAGLLPDIDLPGSLITKPGQFLSFENLRTMPGFLCILSLPLFILSFFLNLLTLPMMCISKVLNKLFGHRGFVHSPLCFLLLLTLIFCLTGLEPNIWLHSFATGYLIHLFLDYITVGGIPWLYPFTKEKYHLTKLKTGSKCEVIIMCCFLIAVTTMILNVFIT